MSTVAWNTRVLQTNGVGFQMIIIVCIIDTFTKKKKSFNCLLFFFLKSVLVFSFSFILLEIFRPKIFF